MTPGQIITSAWKSEAPPSAPAHQTMAEIARSVALAHCLTVADLKGPSAARRCSRPRQEFMALAMGEGFSSPRIGRFLNRDHSTVLWGVKAHRARAA